METVEGAIAARLTADSAVAAIVGTRIFPATDPAPHARPKLYYQRLATSRPVCNDGPLNLAQARIEMFASADDVLTAKRLAAAARASLDGFSGTISGITIPCVRVTDEYDDPTPVEPGQQKPPQRVRLEITIDYKL